MFNLAELIKKLKPVEIDRLRDVGDILQYVIPWAALLAVALTGSQVDAWRWLYVGVITALVTQLLKRAFNYTRFGVRPDGGEEAMPSGHTSSAFMGAFFFYFQFGLLAAAIPLLLAVITGYSRIFTKRHWLRDVVAGTALALLVNYLYFHQWDAKALF